jgi:hypothetical protein
MYWRLDSLPELQHLSDAQRKTLLRTKAGRRFSAKLFLGCLLRGFGAMGVACLVLITILAQAQHGTASSPSPYWLLLGVMVWPITTAGLYQFCLIRIRGQIRMYLLEQRSLGIQLPVCVRCGYAFVQQVDQCPECGASA